MRHLVLLALTTLATLVTLPLAARDHWRDPHRARAVTEARPPHRSCSTDHREHRGWSRRCGWAERRGGRPLTPPFRERAILGPLRPHESTAAVQSLPAL